MRRKRAELLIATETDLARIQAVVARQNDQVELHRIDKKQAEVREKKNGVVVATVREKISADGNELTITTAMKGKADQLAV